jgi:hypothetical protein
MEKVRKQNIISVLGWGWNQHGIVINEVSPWKV